MVGANCAHAADIEASTSTTMPARIHRFLGRSNTYYLLRSLVHPIAIELSNMAVLHCHKVELRLSAVQAAYQAVSRAKSASASDSADWTTCPSTPLAGVGTSRRIR